jgi:hypothetical protein
VIPLSCRRQENQGLSRLKSGGELTNEEMKSEAHKKTGKYKRRIDQAMSQ